MVIVVLFVIDKKAKKLMVQGLEFRFRISVRVGLRFSRLTGFGGEIGNGL